MAGWKFYLNNIEVSEPIGWDAIEFTAKRLPSYGIDSPFSTELTFIGKAANLIKAEYDIHYINAEISILIQSDVNVNGSAYAFVGFLNLSIYSEKNVCDTNGFQVTVGIIEDNFRERFLSRQGVEIDLLSNKDLDENAITPVVLDSIVTHCQELFLIANWKTLTDTAEEFSDNDESRVVWPFYLLTNDFLGNFGTGFSAQGFTYTTTNVFLVNNSDFDRTFIIPCGQIKATIINTGEAATFQAFTAIYNDDGTFADVTEIDLIILASGASGILQYQFVDYQFVLEPGQRFQIYMVGTVTSPDVTYTAFWVSAENFMSITEKNSQTFASVTSGLKIFNALKRSVYLLTGEDNGLVSDTFAEDSGCFWNHFITTGLYIRNANSVNVAVNGCINEGESGRTFAVKTSFQKLFEGLNRIFCLGWQFEQDVLGAWKLRVEKADYFFDNSTVAHSFLKVGQIVQNAMSDKLVNNIQLGYSDKFKNIAISAVTEINADRNYFIANKARADNSTVSLNLLSDIIGSGYAIEFYRRLQFLREDSGSSDRPNDYDLFIIWINRYEVTVSEVAGSGYDLPDETGPKTYAPGTVSYGSNFIAESNGPIDRVYNVYNSPARIAARWWKILGMHTYGLPSAKAILAFQVGQYFTEYSSRIDSTSEPEECIEVLNGAYDVLAENTNIGPDILVSSEVEYLMKPISVEFDAPQNLCSFIDMSYNGMGLVRVTSGGLKLYGFIEESTNKPQDPNSGLSTLRLTLANKINLPGDYFLGDYNSNDYFTGD
jgi:hypothetical protein